MENININIKLKTRDFAVADEIMKKIGNALSVEELKLIEEAKLSKVAVDIEVNKDVTKKNG